jgi:hypothetical protein
MERLKVTQAALIQRLQRTLKKEGKGRRLRKPKDSDALFVVSNEGARRIELEAFAREINILHPWERLTK